MDQSCLLSIKCLVQALMLFSNSDYSCGRWIWTFASCLFPPIGLPITISMLLLRAISRCGFEQYKISYLTTSFTYLVAWSEHSQSDVSGVGTSMPVSPAKFLKHESTTVQLSLGCYESWAPGGQKVRASRRNGKSRQPWGVRTSS